MITTLHLSHFVLIKESVIFFEKGLNILTGETGAGKTILIQAIHLLMGHTATSDMIRKGEDKATIEASFEIDKFPLVHDLLNNAGINFIPSESLIIKREISRVTKNRIFINGQLAPLQLLNQLGRHLFEIAGQNSSTTLRFLDQQRQIVDIYGHIEITPFLETYEKEKKLQKQLIHLQNEKIEAERKTERILWELEDLRSIDFFEDEDILFETYKKQINSQELIENLTFIKNGLETSILPTLIQYKKQLTSNEFLETALTSLTELSFNLSVQLEGIHENSIEIKMIEEKLSKLNMIKKKYHLKTSEISARIEFLEKNLERFEQIDTQIKAVEKTYQETQSKREILSKELTKKRIKAAHSLEKDLIDEIRLLNMPDAHFYIQIDKKEVDHQGADTISFFLSANRGEKPASVKSKTSGGELSRLFFALKLLLSKKEAPPILIFDEIDSNIGGETATIIGKKLQKLSQSYQVLCITHFSQVARFASHHLLISKQNKDGRTLTTIESLNDKEKQAELLRMMGGITLHPHLHPLP